jgi:hypothetical protein
MKNEMKNELTDVLSDVPSIPKPDPPPTEDDLRKQRESEIGEMTRHRQSLAREQMDRAQRKQESGVCSICYSLPCCCGNRGRFGPGTPS